MGEPVAVVSVRGGDQGRDTAAHAHRPLVAIHQAVIINGQHGSNTKSRYRWCGEYTSEIICFIFVRAKI